MSKIEPDDIFEQFIQQLQQSSSNQQFHRLVLSRYVGADPELQRVLIRPLLLKQQSMLSFSFENKTFDHTKNYAPAAAISLIRKWLGTDFKAALLESAAADYQLSFSKKGKALLKRHAAKTPSTAGIAAGHNREKHRYVAQDSAFLQHLGITDQQGQIIPSMSKKWKQINKFIEVLAKAVRETGLAKRQQLHVADFGSGKAYLTFAVHDYLQQLGLNVQVTGVELRQALVDLCNQTATKLQLEGIRFEQGDVQHFKARGINVMIALHACDTATDYAIHMGIRTGAEIILCSPCCHKQIRPQLQSPAILSPLLQHGIHLGQQAEMLTDGLRALLLEAQGYDTQVFEFISLEHTSKNKMILAQKRQTARDNSAVLQQIAELKQFYGINEHCLESLLASEPPAN